MVANQVTGAMTAAQWTAQSPTLAAFAPLDELVDRFTHLKISAFGDAAAAVAAATAGRHRLLATSSSVLARALSAEAASVAHAAAAVRHREVVHRDTSHSDVFGDAHHASYGSSRRYNVAPYRDGTPVHDNDAHPPHDLYGVGSELLSNEGSRLLNNEGSRLRSSDVAHGGRGRPPPPVGTHSAEQSDSPGQLNSHHNRRLRPRTSFSPDAPPLPSRRDDRPDAPRAAPPPYRPATSNARPAAPPIHPGAALPPRSAADDADDSDLLRRCATAVSRSHPHVDRSGHEVSPNGRRGAAGLSAAAAAELARRAAASAMARFEGAAAAATRPSSPSSRRFSASPPGGSYGTVVPFADRRTHRRSRSNGDPLTDGLNHTAAASDFRDGGRASSRAAGRSSASPATALPSSPHTPPSFQETTSAAADAPPGGTGHRSPQPRPPKSPRDGHDGLLHHLAGPADRDDHVDRLAVGDGDARPSATAPPLLRGSAAPTGTRSPPRGTSASPWSGAAPSLWPQSTARPDRRTVGRLPAASPGGLSVWPPADGLFDGLTVELSPTFFVGDDVSVSPQGRHGDRLSSPSPPRQRASAEAAAPYPDRWPPAGGAAIADSHASTSFLSPGRASHRSAATTASPSPVDGGGGGGDGDDTPPVSPPYGSAGPSGPAPSLWSDQPTHAAAGDGHGDRDRNHDDDGDDDAAAPPRGVARPPHPSMSGRGPQPSLTLVRRHSPPPPPTVPPSLSSSTVPTARTDRTADRTAADQRTVGRLPTVSPGGPLWTSPPTGGQAATATVPSVGGGTDAGGSSVPPGEGIGRVGGGPATARSVGDATTARSSSSLGSPPVSSGSPVDPAYGLPLTPGTDGLPTGAAPPRAAITGHLNTGHPRAGHPPPSHFPLQQPLPSFAPPSHPPPAHAHFGTVRRRVYDNDIVSNRSSSDNRGADGAGVSSGPGPPHSIRLASGDGAADGAGSAHSSPPLLAHLASRRPPAAPPAEDPAATAPRRSRDVSPPHRRSSAAAAEDLTVDHRFAAAGVPFSTYRRGVSADRRDGSADTAIDSVVTAPSTRAASPVAGRERRLSVSVAGIAVRPPTGSAERLSRDAAVSGGGGDAGVDETPHRPHASGAWSAPVHGLFRADGGDDPAPDRLAHGQSGTPLSHHGDTERLGGRSAQPHTRTVEAQHCRTVEHQHARAIVDDDSTPVARPAVPPSVPPFVL